jgi:hypothetical protein
VAKSVTPRSAQSRLNPGIKEVLVNPPETRTPNPLIKSQIQSRPKRNVVCVDRVERLAREVQEFLFWRIGGLREWIHPKVFLDVLHRRLEIAV